MITPWEIYWVLQLDSINGSLTFLAALSAIAALAALGVMAVAAADESDEAVALCKKFALRLFMFVFIPAFALATLLPSTKTAAAMIIVPQIVNSPTIQHEAGDLYKLAKEALRDAIAPKPGK